MTNMQNAAQQSLTQQQNNNAAQDQKALMKTFQSTLDHFKGQIAMALPKHITPDRMLRLALTTVSKNPKLLKCTQTSLFGAIIQAAQLGFEPDGSLGQAHLIPFKNNKKGGILEVQFMPGYQGLVDLSRRSGEISTINANAVYQGDEFHYEFGLNETLKHKPAEDRILKNENISHFYAYSKLKDGGFVFVVMTKKEVDLIRARSNAKDAGPWVSDYAEMGKKTALKRLTKLLPRSIEFAKAVDRDEKVLDIKDIDIETGDFSTAEDADFTDAGEDQGQGEDQPKQEKKAAKKKAASKKKPDPKPDPAEAERKRYADLTVQFSQANRQQDLSSTVSEYCNRVSLELADISLDQRRELNDILQSLLVPKQQ